MTQRGKANQFVRAVVLIAPCPNLIEWDNIHQVGKYSSLELILRLRALRYRQKSFGEYLDMDSRLITRDAIIFFS